MKRIDFLNRLSGTNKRIVELEKELHDTKSALTRLEKQLGEYEIVVHDNKTCPMCSRKWNEKLYHNYLILRGES